MARAARRWIVNANRSFGAAMKLLKREATESDVPDALIAWQRSRAIVRSPDGRIDVGGFMGA